MAITTIKKFLALLILSISINASIYEYDVEYSYVHKINSDGTFTYEISLDNKLLLRTIFSNRELYNGEFSYRDYHAISEEWFFKDELFKRALITDQLGNIKVVDKKYPDREALSCQQSNDEIIIISEKPSNSNFKELLLSNAKQEWEGSGVCAYKRYTWLNDEDIGYIYYGKGGCSSSNYFPLANKGKLTSFRINPEVLESFSKGLTPNNRIREAFCHTDNLELNE